MRKLLAATFIVGIALGVTGCAPNAYVGHQNAWAGVWFGDLGIKGNGNNVTVQRGSNLRKLSVWGDSNTATVEDGVTLVHIEFFGQNNTVTLPAGLLIRLTDVGKGNTLVRRPEVWDRMTETPYGPAPTIVPLPPVGGTQAPTGTPVTPPPGQPRPSIQIVPDQGGEGSME
jgi:hypothetical protein